MNKIDASIRAISSRAKWLVSPKLHTHLDLHSSSIFMCDKTVVRGARAFLLVIRAYTSRSSTSACSSSFDRIRPQRRLYRPPASHVAPISKCSQQQCARDSSPESDLDSATAARPSSRHYPPVQFPREK